MRRHSRWRELLRRPRFVAPAILVALICAMAAFPGAFAGWFGHGDPRACDLANSALPPTAGYPFGFDVQGCDLYSNVIYGARSSVAIGLLVTAGTLVLGVILGSLAGYLGGWVDGVIGRLVDLFFGFPPLVGMIVILQALASVNVGIIIASESALTFLGVGLQTPAISWGVQLHTAQQYFTTSPHLLIFPAAFLSATVLGFVLLGDTLRDALDPRLR